MNLGTFQPNGLIFDSNIVQYLLDKHTSHEVQQSLSSYTNEKKLAVRISDYSRFELIRGANLLQETEINKILTGMESIAVSREILLGAAWLETCYRMDHIMGVDEGDKIIGSTAIFSGSYLVTANTRDFPWPFFTEVETKAVCYIGKRKQTQCIAIGVLQPNFDYINRRMEERL